MKKQMEVAKHELASSRCALTDITNKLQIAVKQRDCANKKIYQIGEKLEAVYEDSTMKKNCWQSWMS